MKTMMRYYLIPHTSIIFLLFIKMKSESESQSVMSDSWQPLDYTVHGILQARILEWVAYPFSRASFQPRDRTQVSQIAGGFLTSSATREGQEYWSRQPIPYPVDLPNPGIEPGSPALQADSLPTELSEKPYINSVYMSIPISQYISPPSFPPWHPCLFSTSVSLFLLCK